MDPLQVSVSPARQRGEAVTAILTIGGSIMSPAVVSIDEQNEQVELSWVDDKGDTDAPAPPGAQVTFGVDNPAVVSVDPQSGKLTPLAEGSANVTCSITDQE